MSATTKITILVILILRLLGSGVGLGDTGFGPQLILLSEVAFLFLIIHLLTELKTSFLIYSVILVLILIGSIGVFIKIMHWPGGSEMLFLGTIGGIAASAMLIWSSQRNSKTSLVHLIAGLSLLILSGAPLFFSSYSADWYLSLLNYPIAACTCTILLNQKEKNKGERNLLIVIALQALLFIIKHAIALI